MFKIFTKRSFEFRNSETGQTVQTTFMGFSTVPDWVREDLMFNQGCKTKSIEVVETASREKELENGSDDQELVELREKGKELKIKNASQMGKDKLKAAIAEVEAEAASEV